MTAPASARSGPSAAVLVALGVAVAALAAGAWYLLDRPGDPEGPAPSGVAGASFVAPTRMDAAASRLVATPQGMQLEVAMAGLAPGEAVWARLRDTRQDPRRPTVFLDVGPEKTPVGRLDAKVEGAGGGGIARVTVVLPQAVDLVTVVDLRGDGRWEGFELRPSGR